MNRAYITHMYSIRNTTSISIGLAWRPLLGLLSWCPVSQVIAIHLKIGSIDLIYGCPTFKWVAGIYGTRITAPVMAVWWRHQMKTFFALLVLFEVNPPVTDGFSSQRPVTQIFNVFFDLDKRLSKQLRRRWFETLLCSLCHHCKGQATCPIGCQNDLFRICYRRDFTWVVCD